MHPVTRARRRLIAGSPLHRCSPRGEIRASQVTGPPKCERAVVSDPADVVALSPDDDDDDAVFRNVETLDHRKDIFGADSFTARALARLRIAVAIAGAVARLATDLPGSALIGRVITPLGGSRISRLLLPFFPAVPGRTNKSLRPIPIENL